MPRETIELRQPSELTAAIDEARGDTPRNRWINEACVARLPAAQRRKIRLRGRGRPKRPE